MCNFINTNCVRDCTNVGRVMNNIFRFIGVFICIFFVYHFLVTGAASFILLENYVFCDFREWRQSSRAFYMVFGLAFCALGLLIYVVEADK